jgi:hypothetical protein
VSAQDNGSHAHKHKHNKLKQQNSTYQNQSAIHCRTQTHGGKKKSQHRTTETRTPNTNVSTATYIGNELSNGAARSSQSRTALAQISDKQKAVAKHNGTRSLRNSHETPWRHHKSERKKKCSAHTTACKRGEARNEPASTTTASHDRNIGAKQQT